MRVTDAIRIYESSRGDLAISATATQTAALSEGVYDIWADIDCWIKIAPTANDVTAAADIAIQGQPIMQAGLAAPALSL